MNMESTDHAGLPNDPNARCGFTLTVPERWRFIEITKLARLTAGAVHHVEHGASLAHVVTMQAHAKEVDKAAAAGTLRLFDPITFTIQDRATALATVGGGNQCLVCWDDFVSFAKSIGIEVFVRPAEVEATPAVRPKSRQAQQEDDVLRVIAELGYDPRALPAQKPGQSGVKSAVRKKLKFSNAVFKKAWERLRADDRIADADG